ncbi:MAG: DUF4390 domain-containing protein [Betaproteobacteria bacterium]|nr:DUF4390 domain-containing protein [Betaproteobacteria bacterium]MBI2509166.1 DUF4390 domain-containing protein [Betaproteobacteria bacterium]
MTASSTRCCRRHSWLAALAAALWLFTAAPARADGIEVKKAALVAAEDGYFLEAEFDIALTPTLEDALNKGVPLYFLLEFELIRPRWYWFNEKLANARQQYRLSYNALTRQYRVGVGTLYQNFGALPEALAFLSRVRLPEIVEAGALGKDADYTAALRMRLDSSQLPRPFQISAVGSRDWSLSSDWHRWTISP